MVELGTVSTILIVLGIILLLVEAASPGFFIAVPGTILIVLGLAALVVPEERFYSVWAPVLTLVVAVPATAATIWAYRKIAPANEPPTTRTAEALVGMRGKVTQPVEPGTSRGKVRVERQIWSATAAVPIPAGLDVEVVGVEGVTLEVKPVEV